ncbi:MAG: hypothetical protein LBD14_01255 [Puniceicoccales bacterium]|jgi:hypothetical protein|nr:hypothetical protein [Puniceicoccales bacterium]
MSLRNNNRVCRRCRWGAILAVVVAHTGAVGGTDLAPEGGDAPRVTLTETAWFDVFSYDTMSASYVAGLCSLLERWFFSEFRWAPPPGGRRVRVELLPVVADGRQEAPYRIDDSAGGVTLYVRWGRDTDWDALTVALSHAFLTRVFQAQGVKAPVAAAPWWLVAACSREVAQRSKPALVEHWAGLARVMAPVPFVEFADESPRGGPRGFGAVPGGRLQQAFWFWRHLKGEFSARRIPPAALLAGLVGGEGLEAILARHFPDVWKDADRRALWWPVGYARLVNERGVVTFSMKESREYLADATAFIFAPEGEDRRFAPGELVALRHLDVVREEIRRRHWRLKLDILHANPVWHNAWQSCGVFFEGFASKRMEDAELARLWEFARAEIVAATALESEVDGAIGTRH